MQNSQWEISSGRKKKFGKIASFVAQLAKNPHAMRETWVDLWVGKMPWRRERLPTPVLWPGEFHGVAESDTTQGLLLSLVKNWPMSNHAVHCKE